MAKKIRWSAAPPQSDLAAAFDYLSLQMPAAQARRLVAALRRARPMQWEAKDLLRAARLPELGPDEPKVRQELKKLKKGEELAPVLLVRGNHAANAPLIIADGYHRLSAAFQHDESAHVACRIAG